jgi:hypothetical protein
LLLLLRLLLLLALLLPGVCRSAAAPAQQCASSNACSKRDSSSLEVSYVYMYRQCDTLHRLLARAYRQFAAYDATVMRRMLRGTHTPAC